MTLTETWKYVFVCLAVVILTVARKNYLVYLFADTTLCVYLCPSMFSARPFAPPVPLGWLFTLQIWIQENTQAGFDALLPDQFCLFTALVGAPLIEEGLYRGPLYLTKAYSRRWVWWSAALVLSAVFALSHARMGLSLLPLFLLGTSAAWLIMKTDRFWPSLALHALFNFYFSSIRLCPFLGLSD